jgi:hypothetical protein
MAMLKLRTRKWKRLCQSQAIPLFLQQLHVYAMSLKVRSSSIDWHACLTTCILHKNARFWPHVCKHT